MLEFNKRGLLIPAVNIPTTLTEFQTTFAPVINSHRENLYNRYFYYSTQLKKVLGAELLTQWINGSYVTKEDNPQDIDLVTFVDFQLIEKAGEKLNMFKYPNSEKEFGVDAYIVKMYPKENKLYAFYQGDYFYWKDKFTKTKRNKASNRFAKGFLEISF